MASFDVSVSALQTASLRQSLLAHNAANSTTPGFRPRRLDTADLPGGGVRASSTPVNAVRGPLELTGRPFDVAVQGEGFLRVSTPQGERFTRAGVLTTNAGGNLVTPDGNRVLPGVVVPGGATDVRVGSDGRVSATVNGAAQELGRIGLARFTAPDGLAAAGDNLLAASAASGAAATGFPGDAGFGVLVPGTLEGSGTDLIDTVVGTIANRAFFAANLAPIRANDEMLGSLLDTLA